MDFCVKQQSLYEQSNWVAITLLFLCGSTVALHIGKVPPALPELRQYWQLSLTQVSLIVSLYALLIAVFGTLLGQQVQRLGYVRFAVFGVGLIGIASLAGSQAPGFLWLLISRTAEGFGWIVAAISLPALLGAMSSQRDQPLVMGIWGSFVPVGTGAMLLLSPVLQSMGQWQLAWQVSGWVSLLAAAIILMLSRHQSDRLLSLTLSEHRPNSMDLRQPALWVISACFMLYSFQFTSVTSFIPSMLVETSAWSLPRTSQFVAIVVMSNLIGNIFAGVLLKRGVSSPPLLLTGAIGMGTGAMLLFIDSLWLELRLGAAFGFAIVGGLIPGTCFALLPRIASSAAAVGLLFGLMLQFIGVGQLLGPIILAASVEHSGNWQSAGYIALIVSFLGVLCSIKMGRYRL